MANQQLLHLIRQGVEVWNAWRNEHPGKPDDFFTQDQPGVDLSEADLQGVDLQKADLKYVWLANADLRGANLSRADLRDAFLKEAKLRGAKLQQAVLSNANLRNADLHQTDLHGTNLYGADLSGADLRKTNLVRAVLQTADLSGADLREVDLSGVNLYWASLREAHLSNAKLLRTYFENADLTNADLTNADLTNAYLKGASLRDADLSGANLRDAVLQNADLRGASLHGADLIQSHMEGADLRSADLRRANLFRAELSGVQFSGTLLGGSDFNEATMFLTLFAFVDLRDVKGLETINHIGPSTLDLKSVLLPQEARLEHFLRGVGFSTHFIDALPSLISTHVFPSRACMINSSKEDQEFAQTLATSLQTHGICCWVVPEQKWQTQIPENVDQTASLYEKRLMVLSKHSLESDWIEEEIKATLAKEHQEKREVLVPVRLDASLSTCPYEWATTIQQDYHIHDFSQWRDEQAYQHVLTQLVQSLSQSELP